MKPKICFPTNFLTVSSYIFSSTLFSGEWWRIYIKCIAGCEVFTENRRKNTVCSLCWVVGWIDFWSSKIDICHVVPNCFITAIQKCCFFKGTELPAFNIFFLLEWFFPVFYRPWGRAFAFAFHRTYSSSFYEFNFFKFKFSAIN